MKRLVREPLVHFLLLGAALFALHSLLNRDAAPSPDEIVVSSGQIENLAATFASVWQRPPTPEDLEALVDDHVKEEVLNREAVKLGLDRHDTVIRRRLQQKMEFFVEDFAGLDQPTDEQLVDHLAQHPEKFQEDARFTFRQVYLNPDQRGDRLESGTAALLARLKEGGDGIDISDLGDRLLLPQEFFKEPRAAVAAQFGGAFAEALEAVPVGEWAGPIPSGYGRHLVRVSERTEARMPALAEVRRQVERSFTATRREEAERKFLDQLLQRYTVRVEWPEAGAGEKAEGQAAVTLP